MKNHQKILFSAMGLVLATGIAISQPTITPSGESLTVAGVEASNGAILRVTGPNNYRFVREFSAGENTSIDLKNTPFAMDGKKLSALPAGAYSYELLSRPGGEIVRGTFNIGATDEVASTSDEPVAMDATTEADIRALVVDDSLQVDDADDDGFTQTILWSNNPDGSVSRNWKLTNDEGVFKLQTYDGSDLLDRMTVVGSGDVGITTGGLRVNKGITAAGGVGIGTNYPLYPLDIANTNPVIMLTDSDGGASWKLQNDAGRFSLAKFGGEVVVVIEEDSLANSLVIDSSGVSVLSSRAAKSNVKPTSAEQVLAELDKLPIYTWNYTKDDNKALHIGPMAEDFHQRFGFGGDAKRISALDTGGLALAGVKALQEELNKRDAEIEELKETVALLLERSKK